MKELNPLISYLILTDRIINHNMVFVTDKMFDGSWLQDHMENLKSENVIDFDAPHYVSDPSVKFTLGDKANDYFQNQIPKLFLDHFDRINSEKRGLEKQIASILNYDQNEMHQKIVNAKTNLKSIELLVDNEEHLSGLKKDIKRLELYFEDLTLLNESYQMLYTNILQPIKIESTKGVKTTTIWAVIGIILTTLFSIILSIYFK